VPQHPPQPPLLRPVHVPTGLPMRRSPI
jgi:hypothetical protein